MKIYFVAILFRIWIAENYAQSPITISPHYYNYHCNFLLFSAIIIGELHMLQRKNHNMFVIICYSLMLPLQQQSWNFGVLSQLSQLRRIITGFLQFIFLKIDIIIGI